MSRTVLKITGSDRATFLQGLVTNDVDKVKDGLVYAALLSPQGKYLADFFMFNADDAILIDVDTTLAPPLGQRLSMYKLRADVEITSTELHVHRGLDAPADDAFADPRDASLGWRAYRETADKDDATNWAALRVAAMVPETGSELIPNESYILEMGFERLNGVDFKKGCYVGQEVTARMKHKTSLRKGLARVSISGDAERGDEITVGGKAVGTLTTRSGDQGLAYVRFDKAVGELSVGSGFAKLID